MWARTAAIRADSRNILAIRMNRWAINGVLDRVFAALQTEDIININEEVFSLDSTLIKVQPDGSFLKKPQAIGKSRGGWDTKIHMFLHMLERP
jgi:hypothetical protein